MNPGIKNSTQNDMDRYLYHNLPEYHHHKRNYYREKYRQMKDHLGDIQNIIHLVIVIMCRWKIFRV